MRYTSVIVMTNDLLKEVFSWKSCTSWHINLSIVIKWLPMCSGWKILVPV